MTEKKKKPPCPYCNSTNTFSYTTVIESHPVKATVYTCRKCRTRWWVPPADSTGPPRGGGGWGAGPGPGSQESQPPPAL
jgi:hypothetical protein